MSRKPVRSKKPSSQRAKISEAVQNFAGGFWGWAEDDCTRQSMLNIACNAWNIGNLPLEEQERALAFSIREYERYNPSADDSKELEHDMRKLIERKQQLFSSDRRHIVSATFTYKDGKPMLVVAALNKDG